MTQRLRFGLKRFIVGLVTTNGRFGGILGDALTAGQLSGGYVGNYPKEANFSTAEAEIAAQTGGGVRIGQVVTGDRPAQPFVMSAADFDTALVALAVGGAEDTTNSLLPRISSNPANLDLPALFICFQERFYDPSRTSGANYYWMNTIYPNCTIEPQLTGASESAFAATSYRVVPTYTAKEHTGKTFSSASGMLLTDGLTDWYAIPSNDPLYFAFAKASGTGAQTFTLPYLPSTSVVTNNATMNECYRNSVAEALTSASTSTGELVTATGADEDELVFTIGTNFVASS